MKEKYCYEYPRPAVTTDIVVFGKGDGELKILLIERNGEPFKGYWALPGGFLEIDEDAETGALRELKEETNMDVIQIRQLHTFTKVDRDPRGRTISIVFYGMVDIREHTVRAGDDAGKVQWFPLSELPPLAFDHEQILQMAMSTNVEINS